MNRIVVGAVGALSLAASGIFWWQGRADDGTAPTGPAPLVATPLPVDDSLPIADAGDAVGPELPEASEQSREQRRFGRLDRDRDGRITRNEMLAPRTRDFRKLDVDGNNLLTFEEWAVATSNKFKAADANGDLSLNAAEFATTKPKERKKPACRC